MENDDRFTFLLENLWKPLVLEDRRMENHYRFAFLLETYENLWFWEIEEWKTMTVLLFCLKTYETFGFGRSKSTTLGFWTHQDQQSCVGTWFGDSRIAPGPANLCWYR